MRAGWTGGYRNIEKMRMGWQMDMAADHVVIEGSAVLPLYPSYLLMELTAI